MHRIIWAFFAAVALIGLVIFVDEPVSRLVDRWASRDLLQFFAHFSNYGTYLFYVVFVGLYGFARITRNSLIDQYCRAYLTAQLIVSFALVRALKIIIGRMRPAVGADFNFFSMDSQYNSFPSGHAADVFVGALILFMLLRQSRWRQWRHVPLLYAVIVAIGRITGGWHYVADVAGGAIIGIYGAFCILSRFPACDTGPRPSDQF